MRATEVIDTYINDSKRVTASSSRGDKTPLELFLAGLIGWDAILLRTMSGVNASDAEG